MGRQGMGNLGFLLIAAFFIVIFWAFNDTRNRSAESPAVIDTSVYQQPKTVPFTEADRERVFSNPTRSPEVEVIEEIVVEPITDEEGGGWFNFDFSSITSPLTNKVNQIRGGEDTSEPLVAPDTTAIGYTEGSMEWQAAQCVANQTASPIEQVHFQGAECRDGAGDECKFWVASFTAPGNSGQIVLSRDDTGNQSCNIFQ